MAVIDQRIHAAHFPATVKNVLAVASGLQDPRATARILSRLHAREAIRIHLLAVEIPPSGYARFFLGDIDFRKVLRADGLNALAPLRSELDAAGIPYRFHVEIGRWLATIARFSREIACARIVVGDNPRRPLYNLLLRHDCWRIRSYLQRSGHDCAVVQGDEAPRASEVPLAGEARPH
jgi:hypothetical protein